MPASLCVCSCVCFYARADFLCESQVGIVCLEDLVQEIHRQATRRADSRDSFLLVFE